MSKTLYERVGYKALKLFTQDQIAQWVAFLRHNKQAKEEKGQIEKAHVFGELIADFVKAEQELINGVI